jgi:hypothetical protein
VGSKNKSQIPSSRGSNESGKRRKPRIGHIRVPTGSTYHTLHVLGTYILGWKQRRESKIPRYVPRTEFAEPLRHNHPRTKIFSNYPFHIECIWNSLYALFAEPLSSCVAALILMLLMKRISFSVAGFAAPIVEFTMIATAPVVLERLGTSLAVHAIC